MDPDRSAAEWEEKARALLSQGRREEALSAARRAVDRHPAHPAFSNTLGLVLESLGRLDEAARAFRAALARDPASPLLWNNLGNVLGKQDRLDDAESAYRKALAGGDQPLVRANLAAVLHRSGRLDEAAAECRRAIDSRPEAVAAWINLAAIENDRELHEEAERAALRALELDPGNPRALNNLGLALQRLNRVEDATGAWRRALAGNPGYTAARANLAGLLENLGRLDEARTEANAGLDHAPDDPQLNWVLAKCDRREDLLEQALARLERLSAADLSLRWRQSIAFESGRILDRMNRVDEAWAAFADGNRAARQRWLENNPGPNAYLAELDACAARFDRPWVASWSQPAPPADGRADPVFLVGFPRSGTTLLDLALNAHPGISVIEEGPMLAAALAEIEKVPGGYPDALARLDESRRARLRAAYFSAAERAASRSDQTILVDKLPLNAARAALIHRVFPEARFILALRHPADVCLSCFMQEFGFNDAMANFFTLDDTVALYARVMDLWQTAERLLPLAVHRVRYEDMVGDIAAEAGKLLDFLGLAWDDRVLDPAAEARRRGRINTPSYHQVTRPIYTEARGRWQRYRTLLAPWLPALEPYAARLGYTLD